LRGCIIGGAVAKVFSGRCKGAGMNIIEELWQFLKERKKWWLLPIILFLLFLGFLIVMTSGSALGPFIYTLF
jgi:uncharacterized protein DUF5989